MWKQEEGNYFKEIEFQKTTVYKRKNPIYYDSEDVEISKEQFATIYDGKVIYMEKQLTYNEYHLESRKELEQLEKDNSDLLFNFAINDIKADIIEEDISNIMFLLASGGVE